MNEIKQDEEMVPVSAVGRLVIRKRIVLLKKKTLKMSLNCQQMTKVNGLKIHQVYLEGMGVK